MMDDGAYRFTHDRVQQSAIELQCTCTGFESRENANDYEALMKHLGLMLYELKDEKGVDDRVLYAALRIVRRHRSISKMEMANLCMEGAQMSKKKAAFRSALMYAEAGIQYLDLDTGSQSMPSAWCGDDYNVTLEFHNLSTEMNRVEGNSDTCKERVNAVAT